jgi:hypothetical protein
MASSCSMCLWVNERRNVPNVDGARTPEERAGTHFVGERRQSWRLPGAILSERQ